MDWLDLESLEALLEDSDENDLKSPNFQTCQADGPKKTSSDIHVTSQVRDEGDATVFQLSDYYTELDNSTIPQDSEFSGNVRSRLVDGQTISGLKEKLLSGNVEEKLSALKSAVHFIERSPTAKDSFVDANVIECVIETFGSSENILVVRAAFALIEELIQSPRFTSGTSACLLIKYLMRVAAEASWVVDTWPVTVHGIQLTSKIIILMTGAHQKLNTFCCTEQLTTSGQIILDNSDVDKSSVMSMFHLVHTIITLNQGILSFQGDAEKEPFVYLAHNTYVALWRAANALNDFNVDMAICHLGLALMGEIQTANEGKAPLNAQFLSLLNASACERIVPLLAQWTPVSFANGAPELHMDGGNFKLEGSLNMLRFVSANYKNCPSKPEFTAVLEQNQYLLLLPVIDQMCKTGSWHRLVRSLLAEFMAHLATKWLGTGFNWHEFLTKELLSIGPNLGLVETLFLPSTTVEQTSMTKLLEHLHADFDKENSLNITTIVFQYLLQVNANISGVPLKLFDILCSYFQTLIVTLSEREQNITMNSSIFKAVWLCFVIGYCQHSNAIDHHLRIVNEAVFKCVSTCHLNEIYTHHPAILGWAFGSGSTNEGFRSQVMILWLDTEGGSISGTLMELLSSSKDATIIYLKLLIERCNDRSSMMAHLSEFPSVLQRCDSAFRDAVASDAWILLPNALVKASTRHQHFGIVPLLILCREFTPALLDQDLLLKIVSVIPATVDYKDGDAALDVCKNLAVFKFISRLIERVNKFYENVILTSFLNNEGFILSMERALSLHHDSLTITVLDLLVAFLKFQRRNTASSCNTIKQTYSELMKFLCSPSPDLKMAALRVLHLMLPDDDVLSRTVPVIEMGLMNYCDLAKIYYRIHTIASRVVFDEEDHVLVWDCLCRILKYVAGKDAKHGVRLAHYRITYDLICTTVQDQARSDSRVSAMFRFVDEWAKFHSRSSPRALRPTLFDRTMNLLAATAENSSCTRDIR